MAEPKTRPTEVNAKTYLEAIADIRRRADALRLLDLFTEVTGEPPVMWGPSIVGFGEYKIGEGKNAYPWPLTGFAVPKDKFTLYAMARAPEVAAKLSGLGKYKQGGGCLYIKQLSDIDEAILREIVTTAIAIAKARSRC